MINGCLLLRAVGVGDLQPAERLPRRYRLADVNQAVNDSDAGEVVMPVPGIT